MRLWPWRWRLSPPACCSSCSAPSSGLKVRPCTLLSHTHCCLNLFQDFKFTVLITKTAVLLYYPPPLPPPPPPAHQAGLKKNIYNVKIWFKSKSRLNKNETIEPFAQATVRGICGAWVVTESGAPARGRTCTIFGRFASNAVKNVQFVFVAVGKSKSKTRKTSWSINLDQNRKQAREEIKKKTVSLF